MPHLREAGTDSTGAEISEAAVQFLRAHLETMTHEANAFYIDAPTIEILAEDHAPSLLINRLREILNRRDCADVEVIGAAPATEQELAGVIDRRARSEEGGSVATEESLPETVEADGDDQDEDDDEDDDGSVMVNGRQLKCVVCHGTEFEHKRAQLHSAAASFFNVEWMGPTAECYICNACGYVHWFMR